MTAELISHPAARPVARLGRLASTPVVAVAAGSVFVLRLLFVTQPPSPDEAGFLLVGSQWHSGGTSLYGSYWVDRPPLLIGIFRVASLLGGVPALRVIGAIAAALTVVLLASAAGRVFGRAAAAWTAVVAGALLVTPIIGAQAVNGELLAALFIALGFRLAIEAVYSEDAVTARAAALGTGLAAVLAVLVKQNMVDVVIFATVCWVIAWRTRRVTGRSCAELLGLAVVGGILGYALVMLWAMAHGTSPLGVYEATYPFRIKAGHVLATTPGDGANVRLGNLLDSALICGGPLVLVAFLATSVRRTPHPAVVWAIIAATAYACVSILAGGSYWLHYLVEGVPVVALAAGAVAVSVTPWVIRVLAALVVGSAVLATVSALVSPPPSQGNTVGLTLAAAGQPGDTVLSAFGDADIPQAAGMSSPYPYLWSLPSRTLDPDMALLRNILAGPQAPTWIVVRGASTMNRLADAGVEPMIQDRYRPVGTVCGRPVYLLRTEDRAPLQRQGSCTGTVLP